MRRPHRLIRNIVQGIIAAIVVLAGVLLFNVVTHTSRQIQVAAVPRVPVDEQAAAAMPPRDTAIGMMSAALARLEDHRLPTQARGAVAEMFDTLAPEMQGFNRVVLSNLWLFKPLLLREFEKTGPTEATIRTTTALTIFKPATRTMCCRAMPRPR
jgi:hypothetical protein